MKSFAVVGMVFLLLFAGVWTLAEIGVRRPVGRIAVMAQKLGSGDLSTRISLPLPAGELGGVMAELNATAASLQRQHAAIDDLNQKLTQSQQTEARTKIFLVASEAEFRTLAESMPQIVWITRPDGWNIYFNHQWMDYTGQTLEESMGHGWNKPFHPDDRQSAWNAWQNATKNNGIYSIESRLRRADGTYRWWLVRGVPLFDDSGNILKWFGTCTDIHDLKIAEQALAASELKLQTALTNMSQGLCMFDADARLVLFNPRFTEIYGLSRDVIAPGMTTRDLIALTFEASQVSDVNVEGALAVQMQLFRDNKAGSTSQHLTDGRTISIAHRPLPDGGFIATFEDVTERIRTEERIRHFAHYDALTDLPNRVLFREQLEQALKWIHRGEQVAVLYLDLDHFKTVNDSLGHPVGDGLLKAVSGRLHACLRTTDSIARLGGDEFAIIQTAIKVPSDVTDLVTKIFAALGPPFDVNGHQLLASTSIGIAVAPGDGIDPDQLLKNADLAMYGAKADGRGVFHFFEPDMDTRAKARRVLEIDLREGIQRFEFELHYQPIVNLQDNTISACEALLRWHHPKRGMVSPADFIPIAEETGLIVPIGEWVLRTACAQAATWPDNIKIAVNVSPVQFKNGGFVQLVINALAMSGLTPQRLELEITEAVLIHDDAEALVLLHQLRELGVRIAMDDFGTGYSSLSYLQRFPFDKIKIDQSFIKGVDGSVEQQSIVQAVMTIAKTRNMTTTAEGVETEQQREILRTLGCTELQGYLFSRPISAAKVTELILSHRKIDARVA